MKPLNPNSMIQGRYLIVQPIGKGGMGEVYLAVDQRLGSAVALKRTFFSEDSMLGNAFEREARILARLRHPVLPKVIDHFAEGGDQFLVMEHISGDDIAKRLEAANKPFPVSWVMFWADQMLDALSYLHSHEPPIVHRDIKPQNLKLTDDNHIVLLDFGLSKDFDSTSSGLNSASVAGYSPHFASMEQIRGTGTDARSDLYSLAATLYQMLTNVIPPDALTRADALLGGKPDPILPLSEANPEVSRAISDVILKAVAIRQDERYSSASEMQKALRRAFNKEKGETTMPEPVAAALPVVAQQPVSVSAAQQAAKLPTHHSEMETRVRTEAPKPLEATLKMDKPAVETAALKQSELKTAVFENGAIDGAAPTSESVQVEQTRPQVNGKASAAAAGAASAVQPRPASAAPGNEKKKSSAGLIIGALVSLALLAGVGGGAVWYLSRSGSTPPAANAAPANVPAANSAPSNQAAPIQEPANVAQQPVLPETPANMQPANKAVAGTTPKPAAPKANAQTPGAKTPPKAQPKDDRTVIVQ